MHVPSSFRMVRLALGPVSLSFALAIGSCGGPVPQVALADDALVLVEDDSQQDFEDTEIAEPEQDPEQVPEQEPEQEPEQVPEQEPEQVPEQEPEQVPEQEPEQEPEQVPVGSDHEAAIEQSATTDDVLEHIDAATERLDAAVDLLMIAAGGMGAILGSIAFGKLWGPLAGER